MVDLTPEERDRIYQEEKARHEAQQRVKSDAEKTKATADAEKKKQAQLGCLGLVGALIACWIIFQMAGGFGDQPKQLDLKGAVTWTATSISITNKYAAAWSNVKVKINSDYELRIPAIAAGATVSFLPGEFSKTDGTRLNIFLVKPKDVIIAGSMPSGTGYYYGRF